MQGYNRIQFSVEVGEARPPLVTTESELAESLGVFTTEIGEARPPKKAKYTVEQIVDVPGPQVHEDIGETGCGVPWRKYSNLDVEVDFSL